MQVNIQVEKKEDLTHSKGDAGLVEIWTKEIENAINYEKKWHYEAEANFAIYNNEGQSEDRYNVFWSSRRINNAHVIYWCAKNKIIIL